MPTGMSPEVVEAVLGVEVVLVGVDFVDFEVVNVFRWAIATLFGVDGKDFGLDCKSVSVRNIVLYSITFIADKRKWRSIWLGITA